MWPGSCGRIQVRTVASTEDGQQLAITIEGDGVVDIVIGPCDVDFSGDYCTGEGGRRGEYPCTATGGGTGATTDPVDDAVLVSARRCSRIVVGGGISCKRCDHRTIATQFDDFTRCWQGPGE